MQQDMKNSLEIWKHRYNFYRITEVLSSPKYHWLKEQKATNRQYITLQGRHEHACQ